jgi:membrane-associated phospholipid phosphatase
MLAPPLLTLAGFAALPLDVAVGRGLTAEQLPGELWRLIAFSEAFAHGLGVVVLLAIVAVLDPNRRRALPRVAAMSLGAGLIANVLKMMLARTRPHGLQSDIGVWETFAGWFPLLDAGRIGQSFPSAHAATAAGLAVALGWLYPRGRYVFAILAGMSALQRIAVQAHYVSDTFWGAALGCAVAGILLSATPMTRPLDRLERHSARRAMLAPLNS